MKVGRVKGGGQRRERCAGEWEMGKLGGRGQGGGVERWEGNVYPYFKI